MALVEEQVLASTIHIQGLKNRLVRALTQRLRLRLFEIAGVLVVFIPVARFIVNADHSIM